MQIELDFEGEHGQLVAVQVVPLGPGLTNTMEHLELQRGLEQTYGESYPHDDWIRSWFKGVLKCSLLPRRIMRTSSNTSTCTILPYVDRSL